MNTVNKSRPVTTSTPVMDAALAIARENGGRLTRFPGGYWAGSGWNNTKPFADTKTVEALVRRGFAYVSGTYTDESRRTFDTEITLIAQSK